MPLTRRAILGAGVGLSTLALPRISLAALPRDNRLVVIVLRGALDGLHLVQPYGDADFRRYRPGLALTPDTGLADLDGRFGLHPAAADLMPLWKSGELSFVHAVATPYRKERSHFVGQDILELGTAGLTQRHSGWLNSAIAAANGAPAIEISFIRELIVSGPAPVDVWSPNAAMDLPADELDLLGRLYAGEPAFDAALREAVATSRLGSEKGGKQATAAFAAKMLLGEYRLASFSLYGWDTHAGQDRQAAKAIGDLAKSITTLKSDLGAEAWSKTMVLAITEFGRTVRENGSHGTDHGTGGCCVIAGGALEGGKVLGKWPGLKEADLLDGRDLMPTGDVRAVAANALYRQFGISKAKLTNTVFPGLSLDKSQTLAANWL